jgi:hypothetical protein
MINRHHGEFERYPNPTLSAGRTAASTRVLEAGQDREE